MPSLVRIKGAKPSRSRIMALALVALFAALGGAALAAKGGAVKEQSVNAAATLTFSPDTGDHTLFKIGGAVVFAGCDSIPETDPSPEAGGIAAHMAVLGGPEEGFLVNMDDGALPIGPGPGPPGPQPFIEFAVGPGDVNGHKRSFAVFDGGGTSASGTASFLADEPNERCVATAQVAG